VRLGIAISAWDPLLPNLILAGREPLLWQYLNQSCLQIENVQGERRIVISFCWITRGDNQLIHRPKLSWDFELVHAGVETERNLKIGDWGSRSVNPFRRLLEPSSNFCKIKSFELIGIKAREPNAPALWTPDAEMRRRNEKWTAVGI
jgi:hypothetical protein